MVVNLGSPMSPTTKAACIAIRALLSCCASSAALATIPSGYAPQEGTVLSTHIPADGNCPGTVWHLQVRQPGNLLGTVGVSGTNTIWRMSGTYDSNGTFHLSRQVLGGTVDAQVQSDGSLVLRMTSAGDPSPCFNRTVYLPWFRNGNDFDPNGGVGGGF